MSKLFLSIKMAWLSLVEHRRRTILLGSAIAIVTSLFVLLTALATGVLRTMTDSAVSITSGHINVNGFYKLQKSSTAPIMLEYEKIAQVVKQTVPEMDFMVQRGRGGGRLVAQSNSADALVTGIDAANERFLRDGLHIIGGRFEDIATRNATLLFEKQARDLDVKVGDMITFKTETVRGVVNTADLRVVAIARDVGPLSDSNALTSIETLRAIYQVRSGVTGMLQIHVKEQHVAKIPMLAERLRQALKQQKFEVMQAKGVNFWQKLEDTTSEDWTGQKLDVSTWQDEVLSMMWTFSSLRIVSTLSLGILLLVTVVGVTNSFFVSVRERTREIGTLRAIGMQRGAVARLFLVEAGLLGLLGGFAGAALGTTVALVINAVHVEVPETVRIVVLRDTLQLIPEGRTFVQSVIIMVLVAAVAAYYPARRAARCKPIDAMSHFV